MIRISEIVLVKVSVQIWQPMTNLVDGLNKLHEMKEAGIKAPTLEDYGGAFKNGLTKATTGN